MTGKTHPHLNPPPIPLIQETHNSKSDNNFVKLKLCRDPTSYTSELYEFKMSLFENGNPEEFLLLVRKFNMTLADSGVLEAGTIYQDLCTLVRGEVSRQFELFYADV